MRVDKDKRGYEKREKNRKGGRITVRGRERTAASTKGCQRKRKERRKKWDNKVMSWKI